MDRVLEMAVHIEMGGNHKIILPAFKAECAVPVSEVGINVQAISEFLRVCLRVSGRE